MVRFCGGCGAKAVADVRFCRECGTRFDPEETTSGLEERLAALRAEPVASAALSLGHCLFSEGHNDQAIEAFSLAIEADPEMPEAYLALGVVYLQAFDPEKARPYLLGAIEHSEPGPLTASARAYLSMLLLEEYDPVGADAELREAETEDPGSFLVLWKRGEYYFRLGMYRDAETALKKAARVQAPNRASAMFAAQLLDTARERAKRSFTREPLLPQWGRALGERLGQLKGGSTA